MNYGRYEIVEQLGKGTMGVVYKAHDPQINRAVALKILREDRLTSEDFVQRFMKEAMAIGRLSHPNIVTIYDIGQDQGTVYIAMELLEGRPFHEVIKEKKLSIREIADIAIQLAESLDYAHKKGIIHRDIKPSNIILTPQKKVKITDFGIAHIEDSSFAQQTQAGEILGTPVYMSPEQVMGQKLDGRSDLYSLGVILYELAAGKRPYSGENIAAIFRAITADIPDNPSDIDPSIPKTLSDLIIRSMDKDKNKRFQTGEEMAEACKAFLRELESSNIPKEATIVPEKKSLYIPLFVGIAFIIIALTAWGVYYSSSRYSLDKQDSSIPKTEVSLEKASLKIESIPIGAQVFIDGSLKGNSPISLELPLGKHEVRLSIPDYYEWEAQIQMDDKKEVPLSVELVPLEQGNK